MKYLLIAFLVSCQPATDDTRVYERILYTDDGVEVSRGWFDSDLDVPCSWWTAPNGETRCYPAILPTHLFADDQCTRPVAISLERCNQPVPRFMTQPSMDSCEPSVYHHRGPELFQAQYYDLGSGTCSARTAVIGAKYYELGDELELSAIAMAQ